MESVLQNFENPVIPQRVQKVKAIINTIAVSSAEAERGFSRMNYIYSIQEKSHNCQRHSKFDSN